MERVRHPLLLLWDKEWKMFIEENKLWILVELGNEIMEFLSTSVISKYHMDDNLEDIRHPHYIISDTKSVVIDIYKNSNKELGWDIVLFPFEKDLKERFIMLMKKFPLHIFKEHIQSDLDATYNVIELFDCNLKEIRPQSHYLNGISMPIPKYRDYKTNKELILVKKDNIAQIAKTIIQQQVRGFMHKNIPDNWMTLHEATEITNLSEETLRRELSIVHVDDPFGNTPIQRIKAEDAKKLFEKYINPEEYVSKKVKEIGYKNILFSDIFEEFVHNGYFVYNRKKEYSWLEYPTNRYIGGA